MITGPFCEENLSWDFSVFSISGCSSQKARRGRRCDILHRRNPLVHRVAGSEGHLGRKPDGLSVDPRRTRQDAPPESFRRHPRPPRQPERLRTGGAVRNTRDRRGDRRPLSVRADRRFGRARAGRHREDRHRRHLADPRRSAAVSRPMRSTSARTTTRPSSIISTVRRRSTRSS